MNRLIESLLMDPQLAGRLAQLQSVGQATAALIEAAAARGLRLGHEAVHQALVADPAQPRQLSGAELLAVSGGTRSASRPTARTMDPTGGDDGLQLF